MRVEDDHAPTGSERRDRLLGSESLAQRRAACEQFGEWPRRVGLNEQASHDPPIAAGALADIDLDLWCDPVQPVDFEVRTTANPCSSVLAAMHTDQGSQRIRGAKR